MRIEKGIPLSKMPQKENLRGITRELLKVQHGDSIWVPDETQRSSVRSLFWKLTKRHGIRLKAVSFQVDDTDPRGPGFRIWFIDPSKEKSE